MHRIRKWGLTLVATLSLTTMVLLLTGWGAAAAAQITSVFVTNDAAHAVPVREQAHDANGNIKVHEQGTANVNVANTVQVNPGVVSTRATDNPAFQALETVSLAGQQNFGSGTSNILSEVNYTVPAGKELVVESISYFAQVPSTDTVFDMELFARTSSSVPNFLPISAQETHDNLTSFSGSEMTRIYYNPGDEVACAAFRNPSTGSAVLRCNFNGYLVSLP